MLLGTISANLSGNILTDKGINTAGEGVIRAGYGNKKGDNKKTRSWKQNGFLMLPHPLNNEHRFKGIYSRELNDILDPKDIKTFIINIKKITRKNICNLIDWEEYNIGRICTLLSIFVLFD